MCICMYVCIPYNYRIYIYIYKYIDNAQHTLKQGIRIYSPTLMNVYSLFILGIKFDSFRLRRAFRMHFGILLKHLKM